MSHLAANQGILPYHTADSEFNKLFPLLYRRLQNNSLRWSLKYAKGKLLQQHNRKSIKSSDLIVASTSLSGESVLTLYLTDTVELQQTNPNYCRYQFHKTSLNELKLKFCVTCETNCLLRMSFTGNLLKQNPTSRSSINTWVCPLAIKADRPAALSNQHPVYQLPVDVLVAATVVFILTPELSIKQMS